MARKRVAKKEAPAGQEAAAEIPAEPKNSNGSMSKTDAVRAALAQGIDQPEDGVKFIKERFDIDMTRPQFSTNKSNIKKKDEAANESSNHGRQTQKAAASTPASPARPSSNGSTDLAGSVEAIKTLVEQYGLEQVVSIARLFGK